MWKGVILAGASCWMHGPVWAQHPDEMAVVTFNIRYDEPSDPFPWQERKDEVIETIGYFDILGFQEALSNQVEDLVEGMPLHDHYGVGRNDGESGGEHCPIFWRRDRFDLLHAETKWLSAEPDEPGSIGWGASLPRIATLVSLYDRKTGKVIRVANAHFSHVSDKAREMAARLLALYFAMSGADLDILLGDLNATPGQEPLKILLDAGLEDAHDAASNRCRKNLGTFTGFPIGGLRGAPRIDHILVRGGTVPWFCVEERIVGNYYISDHLPVYMAIIP